MQALHETKAPNKSVQLRQPGSNRRHCAQVLSQTQSPPINGSMPRHASQTVELEHELHV